MPVVTIRAASTPSPVNQPFSQSVIVVIASARRYRAKSLGVSPPWNCPRCANGVRTIGVPSVSATSRELSKYSRPMLWMRSRSSAYHSRTSVRMRSTSVDASATTPRKPPRGLTCTTSTLSVIARLAGGHDVLPHVLTPTVPRDHMIERQVVAAPSAVLAGVVVADEDFLARHLHDRARTLHVVRETDHRRRRE